MLGETVDITVIPARIALKFIGFSKKYDVKKLEGMDGESFDSGMIEDMLDIVGLISQKSNEKITKDWLMDNLSIPDLMQFIQFVFAGITQIKNDEESVGDDGKNLKSGI